MKKNIYDALIECVMSGKKYRINFEKREVFIHGKYIVKGGECTPGYEAVSTNATIEDILENIEQLYARYKHSVPSEWTDTRRRYFKALQLHELSQDDMLFGMPRYTAKAFLEGYVICRILTGELRWDEEKMGGRWFWQSTNDRDLIILRPWVEGV